MSPGRATGAVPGSVDSAPTPLSSGRSIYLPTQSQALYRSTSSNIVSLRPSARRPSSCFVDNDQADARENVVIADRHADVCASAVITDNDNDNGVDVGDFDDTLGEIPVASFMAAPSLDLDLAFGAVDSNVDFDRTHLLSSPPPPSPRLSSFVCYCWGAHLRSRSLHYHNHLFPLLVAVLQ